MKKKMSLSIVYILISICLIQAQNEEVEILQLGGEGNQYSILMDKRYDLAAHPALNSLAFVHPATGSGELEYDLSTDGGQSWQKNNPLFSKTLIQTFCAIYNPDGNTDPMNAYLIFVSSGPENIYYGSRKLDESQNTVYDSIPLSAMSLHEDFAMSEINGDVFMISYAINASYEYNDSIFVFRGIWDEDLENYQFDKTTLYQPLSGEQYPMGLSISMSPENAYTGYFSFNANDGSITFSENANYPIIYETLDGGESWSYKTSVQLGGPEGIETIKNFITDDKLAEIFGTPLPHRDSIVYTCTHEQDLSVDLMNSANVACVIGIAGETPGTYYPVSEAVGVFDVYQFKEDNSKACAVLGGRLHTTVGQVGLTMQYSNVEITRDQDGEKLFLSWNDTDVAGVEENVSPDIFVRGIDNFYDYHLGLKTDWQETDQAINVTRGTMAEYKAYYKHATSALVVDEGSTWEVPLIYLDLDPNDPTAPVHYYYISQMELDQEDFSITHESCYLTDGMGDVSASSSLSILKVYPNPATHSARVQFTIDKAQTIELCMYDEIGHKLMKRELQYSGAGTYEIELFEDFNPRPGVYFFRVSGDEIRTGFTVILQ